MFRVFIAQAEWYSKTSEVCIYIGVDINGCVVSVHALMVVHGVAFRVLEEGLWPTFILSKLQVDGIYSAPMSNQTKLKSSILS